MNNWWFLLNCQYPPIHPSSELVLNKMSPQSFYFAGYPNIPLINLIHKHFRPVSKYIRCHYFLCRNNWCFLMDWELSFTSVWNCIFWNVGLTDRWSKYLLVDRRKPHFTRSTSERQFRAHDRLMTKTETTGRKVWESKHARQTKIFTKNSMTISNVTNGREL